MQPECHDRIKVACDVGAPDSPTVPGGEGHRRQEDGGGCEIPSPCVEGEEGFSPGVHGVGNTALVQGQGAGRMNARFVDPLSPACGAGDHEIQLGRGVRVPRAMRPRRDEREAHAAGLSGPEGAASRPSRWPRSVLMRVASVLMPEPRSAPRPGCGRSGTQAGAGPGSRAGSGRDRCFARARGAAVRERPSGRSPRTLLPTYPAPQSMPTDGPIGAGEPVAGSSSP